jgi:hypothetical protein
MYNRVALTNAMLNNMIRNNSGVSHLLSKILILMINDLGCHIIGHTKKLNLYYQQPDPYFSNV